MYTPRPDYPIEYEPPFVTFDLDHASVDRVGDGNERVPGRAPTPPEDDQKPSR
jgi:hypothetical protein